MTLKEMNPNEEPVAGERQLYIFPLLTRLSARPFATMKIFHLPPIMNTVDSCRRIYNSTDAAICSTVDAFYDAHKKSWSPVLIS